MIPKLIHLIWLGNNKPKIFEETLKIIKDINLEYKVLEWNDYNIDFDLKNKELFEKTENLGSKSDILRFEILNKYGGIYMDYDFLQIKKFDEILNYDFFASAGKDNEVWNSIVGSIANHKITNDFLDGLKDVQPVVKNDNNDEVGMVMFKTGPYYLQKIYDKNKHLADIKLLDKEYFFPFPAVEREYVRDFSEQSQQRIKSFATSKTICIHFHTCTWQ
jgi:mannosyltransferase OCH1-like enzyme